jgi:tRNA A37 threonylcarbamoyladenosine synthetase subunit TsaC/SUA5/YrdC
MMRVRLPSADTASVTTLPFASSRSEARAGPDDFGVGSDLAAVGVRLGTERVPLALTERVPLALTARSASLELKGSPTDAQ